MMCTRYHLKSGKPNSNFPDAVTHQKVTNKMTNDCSRQGNFSLLGHLEGAQIAK